jgi:hypothetical protein
MADSCMLRILDEGLGDSLLAPRGPTLDRTCNSGCTPQSALKSSTFIPFADVPKLREGVDPDDDIMIDIKTQTIQKGRTSNER